MNTQKETIQVSPSTTIKGVAWKKTKKEGEEERVGQRKTLGQSVHEDRKQRCDGSSQSRK